MPEHSFDRRSLLAGAAIAYAATVVPGCGGNKSAAPKIAGAGDAAILSGLAQATAEFHASARSRADVLDGELERVVTRISALAEEQARALSGTRGADSSAIRRIAFEGTPAEAIDGLREQAGALVRAQIEGISRLSGNRARVDAGAVLNSQAQQLAMLLALSGRTPVPRAFVPDG